MPLEVTSEELRESNALIEKFESGKWKNLRHDEMQLLFEEIMDGLKNLIRELTKSKDEREYLKEEVNCEKRENENIEEHIEAISEENENMKKENNLSKSLINELQADKAILNNDKYEEENRISYLKEKLIERDIEIEEMRRKIYELSNQISISEKELFCEKEITFNLSKRLESNHKEAYTLKERIAELEEECDLLKSRQEELQFEKMTKFENSMKATSIRADSEAILKWSHEDIDDHEMMRNIEEGVFFSNKICELSGINMNNCGKYSPHPREVLHSQLIPPTMSKSLNPKAEFWVAKNTFKIMKLKAEKIRGLSGEIKMSENECEEKKSKREEGERRSSVCGISERSNKLDNLKRGWVKLKKGKSVDGLLEKEKEIERLRLENNDIRMELGYIKKYMYIKCGEISQLEGELENSNDSEAKCLLKLEENTKLLLETEQKLFEINHAFEKYKKIHKDFRLELIEEKDRYETEIFELTEVCNEYKEAYEKCEYEKQNLITIVNKMKEQIKENKNKIISYEENIKIALSTKIEAVFERIIEQQKEEVEVYESPERTISQKSKNNNSLRAHQSDPTITDNDLKNYEFLDRSSNIETTEWPSVLDLNEKDIKRHHKISEEIVIDGKVLNSNNDTSFLNAFDGPDICVTLVLVDKVIDVCLDMVKSKEYKETNTVELNTCNQESNTEPINNVHEGIMTQKYVQGQEINTDQKEFSHEYTHTKDLFHYSEKYTETSQITCTVEVGVHTSNLTETLSKQTNTESKEREEVKTKNQNFCSSVGINTTNLNEDKEVNTDYFLHTSEQSTMTFSNLCAITKVCEINECYCSKSKCEMVNNLFSINNIFLVVKTNKQMKYDQNVINIHENKTVAKFQKVLLTLESKVFEVCENYCAQAESKRVKKKVSQTSNVFRKPHEIVNSEKELESAETYYPSSKTELKCTNFIETKEETEQTIKFINKEQEYIISLPFLIPKNSEKEQITLSISSDIQSSTEQKDINTEKETTLIVEENKFLTEKERKTNKTSNQVHSEWDKSIEVKIESNPNQSKSHFFLNVSKIHKNNLLKKETYQMGSNLLESKAKALSFYSPIMFSSLGGRNAFDFTQILTNKKRSLQKEGESILLEELISHFKWNFSKLYEMEAEICEGNQVLQDTLILSGKGLASVLKNECFISKLSHAKFIKDSKLYILGNSEIVIESNTIFTKKCSRSYFDGNMGEHFWKITKITIFS